MKIEIGKTYNVANMYKKTFIEVNDLTAKDRPRITRITVWRTGEANIIPQDEGEVEMLQEAIDAGEEYDDIFEFDSYAAYEFGSSWDGYSEDYECDYHPEFLTKMLTEFEAAEEAGYEWDFISWLEETQGYGFDDTIISIEGPIEVTIVDD